MKHTLLYIPVLAALFGFAACSSDNDITGGGDIQTGNAVIINATVGNGSLFTRSNPIGTEEEQKAFTNGDQINVSDGTKAVTYTYDSNTQVWNAPPGEYLTWHSTPVTFNAYYPVSVNGTDNSFSVGNICADQSSEAGITASDYMKATEVDEKESDDHTVKLTFERQTARVIVKITGFNNQYDPSTTAIDIDGVKVYSQLTVPASGNYEAIKPYFNTGNGDFVALVSPTSGASDQKFLEIRISDSNGEETLTVTGIPAMETGKSYTYNVTVGKDKATISDVTVTDWTTSIVIPGGEATVYDGPLTKVTTADIGKVVTADGKVYTYGEVPSGETAVAMIAYVGDDTDNSYYKHGLAIQLDHPAYVITSWNNVLSESLSAHKESGSDRAPIGCSGWLFPSAKQWARMISATTGNTYVEPAAGATIDGVKDFVTKLKGVGGNMYEETYWTSTEVDNDNILSLPYSDGTWRSQSKYTYEYVKFAFAF